MTSDHPVAVHPLLQGLTDSLGAAGANIGADTPLGAALMDPVAALVVPGLGLVLLVVLLWSWRRRQARRAEERVAQGAAAPEPALAQAGGERVRPEALAMLYDTPARREPSLSVGADAGAEQVTPKPEVALRPVGPVTPVQAPAVPVAAVAAAPAGEAGDAVREPASVRLLLSAVDRLLHRVESQQAQIHALLDELKAQSSALVVQGERLLELEARVGGAAAGQAAGDEVATTDQSHAQSLENAITLAAQGLSADELVARCGLSAAEARLINLVHGNAAPAEPSSRGPEATG